MEAVSDFISVFSFIKSYIADYSILQTDGKEYVFIVIRKRSPLCNSAGN